MENEISLQEKETVKSLFLLKKMSKYHYLRRFFGIKEICREDPRYLYMMLLKYLNIKDTELDFKTFRSGLKNYRKKLAKQNVETSTQTILSETETSLSILEKKEREEKEDPDWWKKVPSSSQTKKTVELRPVMPGDYKDFNY